MTTPDQSKGDRSRDEVLAGEYVLGVLSIEDRRKVEARISSDRSFAAIVHRWEENLSEFNDDYVLEAPPKLVFSSIESRLFGASRPAAGGRGLWNSLVLWRSLTFASLALVATYAVFQSGLIDGPSASVPLVAEMAGQNNAISLVASYDANAGRLHITPVAAGKPDEKSLELWLIEGSSPARSLGVLPQTGEGEIVIPPAMRGRFSPGVTLAVSLEPYGGSPTGTATGPVLAVGKTRRP
jgi:anti-sigma-K factor RskA